MSSCASDEELAGFVEGQLAQPDTRRVAEHIEACARCRELVALAVVVEPTSPIAPTIETFDRGQRLGRFIVIELVGKGGMGSVFAAYDPDLDRKVALKLVRPEVGGGDMQLRLMREAQAMARLHHPEVITVYEVGTIAGQLFIAMELVDGGTLHQWLRDAPRSTGAIIDRFVRAGQGLAAAHAVGLVHRDFKADNVLVGRDGRQRVTDFGLARATEADDALPGGAVSPDSPLNESITAAGALVGTPAYMAPEQLDGDVVDARADQFSFCVSLYQALYGELPFAGDNARAIRAAIAVGRVRPATPRSRVSSRVRAILLRGLRAQPDARYPSMGELLDALRAAQQQRGRRYAALSAIAVCVVVSAAIAIRARHRTTEWQANVQQLGTAYEENSDWVDISPDGKRLAYTSDRDGSWRVYVGPLLGSSAQPVTPPHRPLVIYPRWTRDGAALLYSELSSDASAVGDATQVIKRVTLSSGKIDELARGTAEAQECGGQLVLLQDHTPDCANCARIVTRSAGGVTREIFRGPPRSMARWLRCDRAGTRLVFQLGDVKTAALWSLDLDGRGLHELVSDSGACYPFFHPDGRSVIYAVHHGEGDRQIWEQPLSGGAARRLTSGRFDTAPVVSPDGRLLVFNEDNTSFPLFAFAHGQQQKLTNTLGDVLIEPVATHDGRELIMWVMDLDHIVRLQLSDGAQQVLTNGSTPALSPDDATVYFTQAHGDAAAVLAMPRAGGGARVLAQLPHPALLLAFGGDGALHATLDSPAGREAWRVGLDGAVSREAPAPYRIVLPAPAGGWRVAGLDREGKHWLELVAPGDGVGDARNRRLPVFPWTWDTSGASLIGSDDQSYVRVGVDGSVRALLPRGELVLGAAVSPDGQTLYTNIKSAHVRRQVIVNYGDRPRPR